MRPPSEKNGAHSLRLERAIALDAVDVREDDVIRARRACYANITYVDDWVRKLAGALAETGQADNTVVVFTSDHGEMLGERGLWCKMSMFEWSARVPLIVHAPGRYKAARVRNAVSHVDVLPTLCGIAALGGTEPPGFAAPVDGRSLLALCEDPGDRSDPGLAISEHLAEATSAPIMMARKGPLKYVSCRADPELLFDLSCDPGETGNLAGDPGWQEQLEEFRATESAHWDAEELTGRILRDQA